MDNAAVKTIVETMVEKRYYEGPNETCSNEFDKATADIDDKVFAVISEELKDKFCLGFAEGVLFMSQLQNKIK